MPAVAWCWAVAGLFAWLSTWGGPSFQMTDSGLTLLACGLFLTGTIIKMRAKTPSEAGSTDRAILVLLCTLGDVNWLGFLVACSADLISALPIVVLFVLAEVATWRLLCNSMPTGWSSGSVEDKSAGTSQLPGVLSVTDVDAEKSIPASDGVLARDAEPRDNSAATLESLASEFENGSDDQSELERWVRRSYEGVDEQQRRFLAGSVLVVMQPQQTTEEIVIGFCPAFDSEPQVELESDHETVTTRLAGCTPAGMRVLLRRSAASAETQVTLEWYAVQRPAEAAESLLRPALP